MKVDPNHAENVRRALKCKGQPLILLDTPSDIDECESQLGVRTEQLFTPATRYKPQRNSSYFAIDNGAFSGFKANEYLSLLKRERPRSSLCIFATAPDVVGSAIRTKEVFDYWKNNELLSEFPVCFVCQDGQESIPIPWDDVAAIFIGGTTQWKMSRFAEHCIFAGIALGKWVHVGRVNTPGRYEHFSQLGVDSIDGTGLAKYTHMREKIYNSFMEPKLI